MIPPPASRSDSNNACAWRADWRSSPRSSSATNRHPRSTRSLRRTSKARLLELKQQYTTVIVTHTLRQAKRLADYVIYMYMGEVIESVLQRKCLPIPNTNAQSNIWKGRF